MRKSLKTASLGLCAWTIATSCGQDMHRDKNSQSHRESHTSSQLLHAWDNANAPERMGLSSGKYQTHLASLPTTGQLDELPWSGDYWPTHRGGITYRWNHTSTHEDNRIFYDLLNSEEFPSVDTSSLSPAEKYDMYLGLADFPFTRYERERTQIFRTRKDPDFEIPTWEGLCHAWAPATILYKNPGPVSATAPDGTEIHFGSSDIKALLTYFLHEASSMTLFVSRRCNIDDQKLRESLDRGEISHEEYINAMESAECRGINAGAFHIILANHLGLSKQGFIADVTRDLEVWNQAVHGYRSLILDERTENFSKNFAPGTVKQVLVETVMNYTVEVGPTWYKSTSPLANTSLTYKYWLELDENNDIIGGTWVSHERPDFLWMRNKPEFDGFFAPLGELYERSIAGEDQTEDNIVSRL